MDNEQRRQMIHALETAFTQAGVDIYSAAPRLLRFIDSNRPHVEACCSHKALDAYLAKATALDAAEFSICLAFLTAVPSLIQQFVTDGVVKAAESISLPVGPPRKLTPDIEREIVRRVTDLYTTGGVRIGIAQSRVAQQLGIGKRTVQTAWRKRHQIAAQPFQSMSDVWNFLSGDCTQLSELDIQPTHESEI